MKIINRKNLARTACTLAFILLIALGAKETVQIAVTWHELFQLWLDDRYPIAKGRTWDRLFDFLALHYEGGALNEFYEKLEMFLEGNSPDATSKTIKEIVKNAQARIDTESGK